MNAAWGCGAGCGIPHRPGLPEKAALPLLAHGAAMRFFLTRLQDWANPAKDALITPKDPLEYERKLAVHRAGVSLFGFS